MEAQPADWAKALPQGFAVWFSIQRVASSWAPRRAPAAQASAAAAKRAAIAGGNPSQLRTAAGGCAGDVTSHLRARIAVAGCLCAGAGSPSAFHSQFAGRVDGPSCASWGKKGPDRVPARRRPASFEFEAAASASGRESSGGEPITGEPAPAQGIPQERIARGQSSTLHEQPLRPSPPTRPRPRTRPPHKAVSVPHGAHTHNRNLRSKTPSTYALRFHSLPGSACPLLHSVGILVQHAAASCTCCCLAPSRAHFHSGIPHHRLHARLPDDRSPAAAPPRLRFVPEQCMRPSQDPIPR
ncbi:hypothetical protein C8Q78DRAFT_315820 [Trametes maxima]|nr:hypothetical protein C8Q78DRAFT_315820 [Trametes maxima]